ERQVWRQQGIQSMLTIPFLRGEALAGFLGMTRMAEARAWLPEDIRLLELVGDILSGVLERKRAEEAVRRHSEQLEALRYVGMEIAAQLEINTLLHGIVLQALDLLKGK